MRIVDRFIDYVADRVLVRVEAHRPVKNVTVHNLHVLNNSGRQPGADASAAAQASLRFRGA